MATMGRRGAVWKTPDIPADGLKIFACVMMLLSNFGVAVIQNGLIQVRNYATQDDLSQALADNSRLMTLAGVGSVLQLLGGLAVPIFAYMLVEGFLNTSSYRKYLLTMAGFALVSEIPYDLATAGSWLDLSAQNPLVTMTVCLLMLYCLRVVEEKAGKMSWALSILIALCGILWGNLLRADYSLVMVLLTAIFYVLRNKIMAKYILGILASLLYVTGPISFYGIWCYDGSRKDWLPKYAYYVFYPLHLLVLWVIMLCVG